MDDKVRQQNKTWEITQRENTGHSTLPCDAILAVISSGLWQSFCSDHLGNCPTPDCIHPLAASTGRCFSVMTLSGFWGLKLCKTIIGDKS